MSRENFNFCLFFSFACAIVNIGRIGGDILTIGDRIRAIRKEKGLTQKELAEKLGVSSSMIGQYETNVRKPKIGTLQNIASALGVHLSEIIDVDLSDISPSLDRVWHIAEDVGDILFAPRNGKRKITEMERSKIEEFSKSMNNICTEIETSSFINNIFLQEYLSLFFKIKINGNYSAIEALSKIV